MPCARYFLRVGPSPSVCRRPTGLRADGILNNRSRFSKALEEHGADAIHVSSGGLDPRQQIALHPGYQVPFARAIKQEVAAPVVAVGLITEPSHAEAIVANGEADLVALARAMLYNPRWPWHAAAALGASVVAPNQYLRCQPRGLPELFGR